MRGLCESAKLGKLCIDDLCRGGSETLCGFDKDEYDSMCRDYASEAYDYDIDDLETK